MYRVHVDNRIVRFPLSFCDRKSQAGRQKRKIPRFSDRTQCPFGVALLVSFSHDIQGIVTRLWDATHNHIVLSHYYHERTYSTLDVQYP